MAQAKCGNRAQELLNRIHALYKEGYYEVSPDVVSYNSVLKAWKEDDQPEQALELLESMILSSSSTKNSKQQQDDEEDESDTYDSDDDNTEVIQVDVISFNTVLAAFANQGNYKKAIEILRTMQQNQHYPNPDKITYNIILYSLAQSPDVGTAIQAENLLREMMSYQHKTER